MNNSKKSQIHMEQPTFIFDCEAWLMTINNKNIKIIGTFEKPWISGKELCEALGYKDVKSALIKNVKNKHKKPISELFEERQNLMKDDSCNFFWPFTSEIKYHEGKAVYINKDGLAELISKSHIATSKNILDKLIEAFDLNMKLIKVTKEQDSIGAILSAFGDDYTCYTQFSVDTYRIDLYMPEHDLAIECDEFNHSNRDPEYEEERQEIIEKKLKCTFFRFNPDAKDFNVFRLIGQLSNIFKDKAVRDKEKIIESKDKIIDKLTIENKYLDGFYKAFNMFDRSDEENSIS